MSINFNILDLQYKLAKIDLNGSINLSILPKGAKSAS